MTNIIGSYTSGFNYYIPFFLPLFILLLNISNYNNYIIVRSFYHLSTSIPTNYSIT
jgi:hypothetical protein